MLRGLQMQSQHSSPRTGMNWLYFVTNFLVCLAVLFAAKYALDMLAGHATSHFRVIAEAYHSHIDRLQDHNLFGVTPLHMIGVGASVLFPFSRVALRSMIGAVVNAPLMMPLGRLMYYRAIGFFISLVFSPALGPIGMLIVLKRHFQARKIR